MDLPLLEKEKDLTRTLEKAKTLEKENGNQERKELKIQDNLDKPKGNIFILDLEVENLGTKVEETTFWINCKTILHHVKIPSSNMILTLLFWFRITRIPGPLTKQPSITGGLMTGDVALEFHKILMMKSF